MFGGANTTLGLIAKQQDVVVVKSLEHSVNFSFVFSGLLLWLNRT